MRQARKLAQEAYNNGYSIEQLEGNYNHLVDYLRFKLSSNSPRTEVRIYKDCVWLWNGRQKVLRTVYPIEKTIPNQKDLKRFQYKHVYFNSKSVILKYTRSTTKSH
jgi:hypothetical protein